MDFGRARYGAHLYYDFLIMLQYFHIDVYPTEYPEIADIYARPSDIPAYFYEKLVSLYNELFPSFPTISMDTTKDELDKFLKKQH